jgi:hypothetical protein
MSTNFTSISWEGQPCVHAALYNLARDDRPRISPDAVSRYTSALTDEEFSGLERELRSGMKDALLNAADLAVLGCIAVSGVHGGRTRAKELLEIVRSRADLQWDVIHVSLALWRTEHLREDFLGTAFPRLIDDPATFEVIANHIEYHGSLPPGLRSHPNAAPAAFGLEQARILLGAAYRYFTHQRARRLHGHLIEVFAFVGGSLGWNVWSRLNILLVMLPDGGSVSAQLAEFAKMDRHSESTVLAAQEIICRIRGDDPVHQGARLIRVIMPSGVVGRLLERPVETRGAYVRRLDAEVGADPLLRQAAIEAVLWLPEGQAVDLAFFAASRLLREGDEGFLTDLRSHPMPDVGYAADALLGLLTGREDNGPSPKNPRVGASRGLSALAGELHSPTGEAPRTWIGDRAVEQEIEHVISRVEDEMAAEYEAHGEEGEEALLAAVLDRLAQQFTLLDGKLVDAARVTRAGRRVSLRARKVDKREEGAPGVRKAKAFSTDACFVVRGSFFGKPLSARATLVQAKRLYRRKVARKDGRPAWFSSYSLKPSQTEDLILQTTSSVYLFQGPPNGGRGLPIIPALLVRDLSLVDSASGASLSRELVGDASRSLGEWLTYDVLGLRVGDPWDELVQKAEGPAGGRSRRLLDLPRLEIEVSIKRLDEE